MKHYNLVQKYGGVYLVDGMTCKSMSNACSLAFPNSSAAVSTCPITRPLSFKLAFHSSMCGQTTTTPAA